MRFNNIIVTSFLITIAVAGSGALRGNSADITTTEAKSKIPTVIKESNFEAEIRDNECAICFENFKEETKVKATNCLHCFCRPCVDKLIELNNHKCPVCRDEIDPWNHFKFKELLLNAKSAILNLKSGIKKIEIISEKVSELPLNLQLVFIEEIFKESLSNDGKRIHLSAILYYSPSLLKSIYNPLISTIKDSILFGNVEGLETLQRILAYIDLYPERFKDEILTDTIFLLREIVDVIPVYKIEISNRLKSFGSNFCNLLYQRLVFYAEYITLAEPLLIIVDNLFHENMILFIQDLARAIINEKSGIGSKVGHHEVTDFLFQINYKVQEIFDYCLKNLLTAKKYDYVLANIIKNKDQDLYEKAILRNVYLTFVSYYDKVNDRKLLLRSKIEIVKRIMNLPQIRENKIQIILETINQFKAIHSTKESFYLFQSIMQTLKKSLEEQKITPTDQEYAILLKHALKTKSSMSKFFVQGFYHDVNRVEIFKLVDLNLELVFANLLSLNDDHSDFQVYLQVVFEYCKFKGLDRETELRFSEIFEKTGSAFDEKEMIDV